MATRRQRQRQRQKQNKQSIPCNFCGEFHVNQGKWTRQEDELLLGYIHSHGTKKWKWKELSKATGIRRCSLSCQKRWRNYLHPNLKRGDFTEEEEDHIIKLQTLVGNSWKLIAKTLPGRTSTVIMNHCRSKRMREKLFAQEEIYLQNQLKAQEDENLRKQELPNVDLQLTIGAPSPSGTKD